LAGIDNGTFDWLDLKMLGSIVSVLPSDCLGGPGFSERTVRQLKYDWSQNNWLVLVIFLIYNFHFAFTAL